ncbi:MAG: alpha/beta hydrolase family protein [Gemmatimonadales bacterium]
MTPGVARHATVALLGLAAGCVRTGAPLVTGTWAGELRHPRVTLPLDIVIDSTGAAATVTNRLWGLSAAPATIRAAADSVELLVVVADGGPSVPGDTIRFRMAGPAAVWSGVGQRGQDTAAVELVRVDPAGAALAANLTGPGPGRAVGSYRTSAGHLVAIAPFSEFGDRAMLIDYVGGRVGPLLPIGPTRFLLGAAIVAPLFPADTVDLTLGRDGSVTGLRWSGAGAAALTATRVATSDTSLTFTNGAVTLAGTLTRPATPGPHPALVLVHGSNAQPRETFGPWTRYFAGLGYAVLAYDKRGTGASSGDWKQAGFPALASDALAAVRALAARADIRRDKIGLWGISQAGWIMPLVAAQAPAEVAFMVVHAGTGTTVREQGVLNYRNELRFAGLPESAVAIGVRYRMLDDSVTKAGGSVAPVERFYQEHRAEAPWLDEPAPADVWFRGYYRILMDFDPRQAWERVTCPVLLFFGELDANVPPAESWPPIERGLARAGNRRVTQYTLPGANHVFLAARTGAGDEYPRLSRFVPGYFDRMAQWLESNAR